MDYNIPTFQMGNRERQRSQQRALQFADMVPGQYNTPTVAKQQPPQIQQAPDIGTPGGLSVNLQQAGASKAYALKQALDLNRRQQGHINHQMTPQARTDLYAAPQAGTAFYGQQRAGNDASLDRFKQMTPKIVGGMKADNTAANIQNQFAPGIYGAQINRINAETGLTTARTASETGNETRAQGKYGVEMQQAGPRFEQEMAGEKAKTGLVGAQTKQTDAETTAIDRDYRTKIETQAQTIKAMQTQLDDVLRQLGIQNRNINVNGGLDAEISGVNQNELTPQANPQQSAQMPAMQQANPQAMTQMPQMQRQQQQGGIDDQAASIQRAFKSGAISREQAAAQLRALGYED